MEPAKIDWKSVESVFVEDSLYEHINAPKWIDFSNLNDSVQDEAWFCRPDCKHPKTAEDFYRLSPPSKLLSMVGISDMLQLQDRHTRDVKLKRRQQVVEGGDRENKDPNMSTPPPIPRAKSVKEAFKSSGDHNVGKVEHTPKLKATGSARNLLGRDIFSHIMEFCNELKRVATRAKEKEDEHVAASSVKNSSACDTDTNLKVKPLDVEEVARTPLLGLGKEKFGKIRRKKNETPRSDDAENVPLAMDLNSIRSKESQNMLKIRTNPPTPQCFSAARVPPKTTPTPSISAYKSKLTERSILQEVTPKRMELSERSKSSRSVAAAMDKEAKPLDVFWFLKPCTLFEPSS